MMYKNIMLEKKGILNEDKVLKMACMTAFKIIINFKLFHIVCMLLCRNAYKTINSHGSLHKPS